MLIINILMNDIFFSLDQNLADKLVDSLTFPLTIDVFKPKYFNQDETGEVDDTDPNVDRLESDLLEVSLRSLKYVENRDETISEKIKEDEELYNYTFEDQIIGKMQVRSNQKSSYYFYLN